MTLSRVVIALVGALTFVGVYFGLQALSMRPAPALETTPAPDTVTRHIEPGDVAVALPIGSAEPLVRGLQPGARLNVLASLPDTSSGRPLSAVVTRGATIVQPVTPSDPLVVEVSPDDALVLAHLVLGGTQLSYAVWPGGVEPAETPPLDERTV